MSILDEIGLRTGTDKSTSHHGYTIHYENYLSKYVDDSVLLEIGVAGGRSLAMWREWRPTWRVIGVDHNRSTPADYFGDGSDVTLLPHQLRRPDIVIDDGSHIAADILRFFKAWWPRVRTGGVYVVEDLHCSYHASFTKPSEQRPIDFLFELADECMEGGSGMQGAAKPTNTSATSDIASVHFHKSICFIFKKGAHAKRAVEPDEPFAAMPKLSINCARYGNLPNGPFVDITSHLTEMIWRDSLSVRASNALFGDPSPGVIKSLHIDYKFNSVPASCIIAENETITIPPKLVIQKAIYGDFTTGRCIDVTARVAKLVVNQTLSLKPSNILFGDPSPGVRKSFELHYIHSGIQSQRTFKENEVLSIPT